MEGDGLIKKFIFYIAILSFIVLGCKSNGISQENTLDKDNNSDSEVVPDYKQSPEDVIDMHGDITNLDKLLTFSENVNRGKQDKIRIVSYTIEGDPILHDLEYDGNVINLTIDSRRDKYGSGSVETTICKSIEIEETEENTDYFLVGCDGTEND